MMPLTDQVLITAPNGCTAKSAALIIAAMDVLDTMAATRRKEQDHGREG